MRDDLLNRIFWGLVLVGIGVVFLLNQQGIVSVDIGDLISDYWPVILIFIGVKGLFNRRPDFWAVVMLVLGAYFLGRNLGWVAISAGDFFKFLIPAILIGIGLKMIFQPKSPGNPPSHEPPKWGMETPPPPPPPPNWDSDDWLGGKTNTSSAGTGEHHAKTEPSAWNADSAGHSGRKRGKKCSGWGDFWHDTGGNTIYRSGFIGDIHLGHDYWELKPMNISHFIGDTVLDLTKAQIPYGETRLNISSFIGDVKVFVPNDHDLGVTVTSSSFLGDVSVFGRHESGLFKNTNASTPTYADADKKIKIVVSTFIGDVSVTKVG